jgi:hypothetical protein
MVDRFRTHSFGMIEILAEGWNLYLAKFSQILFIILCVYIPVEILVEMIPLDSLIAAFGQSGAVQAYSYILQALNFLLGSIATLAIAWLIEKSLNGEDPFWSDALRHGQSRWLSLVWTGLLAGMMIMALTFCLIVPGIIWGGYYLFWVFVVGLRNLGGKDALDYSKALVKGQWWGVIGVQLVIAILSLGVGFLLSLVLNGLPANPIVNIISNLVYDIVGALFVVMQIVWFLNIDYRRHPISAPPAAPEADSM